jgi:hypothetical protein
MSPVLVDPSMYINIYYDCWKSNAASGIIVAEGTEKIVLVGFIPILWYIVDCPYINVIGAEKLYTAPLFMIVVVTVIPAAAFINNDNSVINVLLNDENV